MRSFRLFLAPIGTCDTPPGMLGTTPSPLRYCRTVRKQILCAYLDAALVISGQCLAHLEHIFVVHCTGHCYSMVDTDSTAHFLLATATFNSTARPSSLSTAHCLLCSCICPTASSTLLSAIPSLARRGRAGKAVQMAPFSCVLAQSGG